MFTAALFTLAKIWKQPIFLSKDEWKKKMYGVYVCVYFIYICLHVYLFTYLFIYSATRILNTKMEYYSAMRKKEILPFETTWMILENNMLSENSESERELLYNITYT